jgi:hypothetical protein
MRMTPPCGLLDSPGHHAPYESREEERRPTSASLPERPNGPRRATTTTATPDAPPPSLSSIHYAK